MPQQQLDETVEEAGVPRDAGFTLVEVIVAFGIFLAMVSASVVVLSMAQASTRDNSRRESAINLATRELAITSDTFHSVLRGPDQVPINAVTNPDPLPGGTAGQPLVVDGVPYTVTRTAQWASVGSTAESTCDEGTAAELAYLRVRVKVTWPGGEDRPVTMDTVLTPLKGTYSDNDGHIGIKVIDRDGHPRSGQSVTISGPSGTKTASTAADGCVLFAFLTPGSYTVTLNSTGYVDIKGQAPSTTTADVQAGQLWRTTISYDQAATINATFTVAAPVGATGYTVPSGLSAIPVTLGNSALLPSGSAIASTTTGTNPRTLKNLWPFASGYQLWAGSCLDNDPAADAAGPGRDLPVSVTPGGTSAATIPIAPIDLKASGSKSNVTAIQVFDNGCPSAGTYASVQYGAKVVFGTVASGTLKTGLPFGTWRIYTGTTLKGTVTLLKGATTVPSVTL